MINTTYVYPRNMAFIVAQEIAIQLGRTKTYVTIDMIQIELNKLGFTSRQLGNAAGHIFRGKNWKRCRSPRSTRKSNHGRRMTLWRYVGS